MRVPRRRVSNSTNTNEIIVALWEKFVLLADQQLRVGASRGLPFGKLRDDPEVFALFEKDIAEVAAVGRARGVSLPADIEARMLQTIRDFPPEMMPSMTVDLLRGNQLGAAVARRQGGGARPRGWRADADLRRDVRGA